MEDARAVALLAHLRDYYRQYGDDVDPPSKLTVKELAGDLVESLPDGA